MVSLLIGRTIVINNKEYMILSPNNGDDKCISLYNNSSKKFLRHYASKVIETSEELNASRYSYDSSFVAEIDNNILYLKVSNPGFINRYVYKDGDVFKITAKDVDPKELKYGFPLIGFDANKTEIIKTEIIDTVLYDELKEKITNLEKKYACEVAATKLRNISGNIKKKKRIVFIGTEKLGENAQYAFIHLNTLIKINGMNDVESLYFARNKIEKEYFDSLNLPCEIWSSKNYSHILYALQAKVAVFSTHTFADSESNSALLACLFGAYRIQLWHGFLAKMVGCATLKNGYSLWRMANMLEDCAVDVVTTALDSKEVVEKYEICFPGADVICTGDARADALFQSAKNEKVDKWCAANKDKIKLLFSPTYRESSAAALAYIKSFIDVCSKIDRKQAAIAIKFHPVFFSKLPNDRDKVIKEIEDIGVLFISEREDSYTIMNKFDAMATDYSSVRLDFASTGKPIILFRPDYSQYTAVRKINPMAEFDMLDLVSYDMEKDDIIEAINSDAKRNDRLEVVEKIGLYTDGKNAERVCSIILSKV